MRDGGFGRVVGDYYDLQNVKFIVGPMLIAFGSLLIVDAVRRDLKKR